MCHCLTNDSNCSCAYDLTGQLLAAVKGWLVGGGPGGHLTNISNHKYSKSFKVINGWATSADGLEEVHYGLEGGWEATLQVLLSSSSFMTDWATVGGEGVANGGGWRPFTLIYSELTNAFSKLYLSMAGQLLMLKK